MSAAGALVRGVAPPKKRAKRDEDEYYCDFAPVAPPVPDGAPGWLRSKDCTWTKVLYDSLDPSAQTGHKSLLLYIPPGLTLPPLELPVWQEVIVVSGVLNWLNADDTVQEAVRPYSHVIRPPGLPHGPFSTDENGPGCTMFCKWFFAANAVTQSLSPHTMNNGYIPLPQAYPQSSMEMGVMGYPLEDGDPGMDVMHAAQHVPHPHGIQQMAAHHYDDGQVGQGPPPQ